MIINKNHLIRSNYIKHIIFLTRSAKYLQRDDYCKYCYRNGLVLAVFANCDKK